MINKLKKSKAGFTLVELIVVVAIIGVLAAVLVPQYIQYIEKSRAGTDISMLGEAIYAAEIQYALKDTAGAETYSMEKAASGEITVDPKLNSILGSKIALNSNAAKVADTKLCIVVDSTGAKWSNGAAESPVTGDTATYFASIVTASK